MSSFSNPNMLIYILSYNEETEEFAKTKTPSYLKSISKIIRLPPNNKYMEFYMYTDYLPNHREEWEDKDYIGTLSWKFFQKCRFNFPMIQMKLKRLKPDIFTIFNVYHHDLFEISETYHPNFKYTWELLFSYLGFSEEEIFLKKIHPFYCNYWVANPRVMKDYIEFASKIKTLIDSLPPNSPLYEGLYTNSDYGGSLPKEALMDLFGKPYYILQPFILERVICWFVQYKKYKLVY